MRGFLILAASAVALSACAPFEHGHYANDVKYQNSAGDPAGTPLVFGIGDTAPATQYAGGTKHWDHGGRQSTQYSHNTTYAPKQSYSAPVSYSQPAQSYAAPVNYAAPQNYTLASHSAHQPATQSTYGYSATTLGGIQFDAEGYAICNETYPQAGAHAGHGAHAPHGYTTAYQ